MLIVGDSPMGQRHTLLAKAKNRVAVQREELEVLADAEKWVRS